MGGILKYDQRGHALPSGYGHLVSKADTLTDSCQFRPFLLIVNIIVFDDSFSCCCIIVCDFGHNTSAFGTCIQKYVIERYVCVIVSRWL